MNEKPRHHPLVSIAAPIALALLAWQGHHLAAWLPRFEQAVEQLGPWGPLLYGIALVVLEPLFVPDTLFALAAGAAFGPAHGPIYYVTGVYTACLAEQCIGRRWLAAPVLRQLEKRPYIRSLVAKAAAGGTRFTFLVRLIPMNQAILSYSLGAVGVPFKNALLGNLGLFLHSLPTVFVGTAAVHMTRMAITGHTEWELDAVLGMIALGVLLVLVHLLTRSAKVLG